MWGQKKNLGSLKKQLCFFSSETMVKLNKVKPTDFAHQKIFFQPVLRQRENFYKLLDFELKKKQYLNQS